MTPEQFAAYAGEGYNRIPVHREVFADLDTPLSTYLKLADAPYSYLLESVQGGEKWGRYSIIGLPARERVRVSGHQVTHESDDGVIESITAEDPLGYIEAFQARFHSPELPDMPRFNGGLVGYFGYDTVRFVEPRLHDTAPPDELETPDILLMVSDEVVGFRQPAGQAAPDRPDQPLRSRRL